ncbi:MAG TPA: M28 family peptidase [Gemmatimonadaceae bacterium]|nr:M28 family peptidase [Gemmatimonadaceae bacterium]
MPNDELNHLSHASHAVIAAAFLVVSATLGCTSPSLGAGGPASPSTSRAIAPGLSAITEADLRRDMFAMASDAMRGREAGTLDEMRATGWVAEQARAAGLQPAGDDGTFFQWWPMRRTRLSENSQITIADHKLDLWRDVVVLNAPTADYDLPIVYIADTADLARTDVRGKAVALEVAPVPTQPEAEFTIRGNFQSTLAAMVRQRASALAAAGAAAAIIVSNGSPELERGFDATASVTSRGSYTIDSAGAPAGSFARAATAQNANGRGRGGNGGAAAVSRGRGGFASTPTFWLRHDMLDAVRAPNARLHALVFTESYHYPSGNVIGVVRGTDPKLAHEYVLYSGHQDHDGTRYVVNGDSIWNGADDNASVSVAMLAAARAFVQHPAPRPVLFVWHGAEERGLLGSRWFVNHPTVPRSEIIAVLNGDMIGRNAPDSAALLGVQPPHKNSDALVSAALRANAELTHFKLDTIWDRPTHREGWYFRSDHLPYARAGIPAVMFSTLLHADYHTPRDEPQRIDIAKLANMTRWMYATGWIVANAATRPDVVPGFKLER